MEETARTEARNYLSAAGFFLIGGFWLLKIFTGLSGSISDTSGYYLEMIVGIGLLIVATLLIILRKRDMIAILFIIFGFYRVLWASNSSTEWGAVLAGFLLLISIVLLLSKEKQKWLIALIPLVYYLYDLIWGIFGYNIVISTIFRSILAIICLYYAFCCASERISLPGRKLLTADESTDFKASGSVLGYLLFALITGGYAAHYLIGESVLPLETFQTIELLCGGLMIFIAILLLAVGKMRFTPVMFLLLGLTNILAIISSDYMYIGIGILMICIGLFAMLRKESRILPGIMLIIYGCTAFFSVYAAGAMISAPAVSVILNVIPCLIAIYLAVVVYSQRNLPKF